MIKNQISSIISIIFFVLAGMTVTSDQNVSQNTTSYEEIVEMINQVDESLVFYYFDKLMEFGPRYTGSPNCTRAGDYIYEEFEKMGLEVEFHNWTYTKFKSRNVVATLKGSDSTSDAIIIISAHYDCTPGSLGADDDGSGVAVVLASAKVMSNYSFNHTVRFIAFSGEEVGTYGSFTYARDSYNKGDNIYAVLNADMVGYADSTKGGKMIRFFQTDRSAWIPEFAQNIAEKYMDLVDMNVEAVPNYRGADHQAFIHYGYDAVFIAHHDGYPWANSPEDTPDHINHTYLVKTTKFHLAVLAEMANKPIDIQVIIKYPKEGRVYFFNRSLFPLHLGRFWYTELRGTTFIFGRAIAKVNVISKEEINRVIFCIDDIFISWDSQPPYEWKIQGKHYPPLGRHKLVVYAYTKSGKIALDEMDIRTFTLSCQYCKW